MLKFGSPGKKFENPCTKLFNLPVMVMENSLIATLPAASLDVYVTVVMPTGNASPDWWLHVRVCTPELSLAVGWFQFTTVARSDLSLILAGMFEMVGFSMSVHK